MKEKIAMIAAALSGCVSYFFGGWSMSLETLMIFMAVDYVTGLVVAGVFHKSNKSESGRLESHASRKGLTRKGMMLAIVLVAYRLDLMAGSHCIKDAACAGFIVNEALSITENAGLMGIQPPEVVVQAVEILAKKAGKNIEKDN